MPTNLLEKFAGLALQGIMANPVYANHSADRISEDAIKVATSLVMKLEQEFDRSSRPTEPHSPSKVDIPNVIEEYDRDNIPVIRDAATFIPLHYSGKKICFIGSLAFIRKHSLTVELNDKFGTLIDISLDGKEPPYSHQNFEDKRVYAIMHFENNFIWYTLESIEDVTPKPPEKLAIAQAITLIKEGKVEDVLSREDEDVFKTHRETMGDHRAAWVAFEHVFEKWDLRPGQVKDQVSSREIDDVSQLIVDHLFAKYE